MFSFDGSITLRKIFELNARVVFIQRQSPAYWYIFGPQRTLDRSETERRKDLLDPLYMYVTDVFTTNVPADISSTSSIASKLSLCRVFSLGVSGRHMLCSRPRASFFTPSVPSLNARSLCGLGVIRVHPPAHRDAMPRKHLPFTNYILCCSRRNLSFLSQ
jgi:hypothetical protein